MDRRDFILQYAWREGRRFQFGQQHDSLSDNGKKACGMAAVQLIGGIHGHDVTLDQVARSANYPVDSDQENDVGFYGWQVILALKELGIKYEVRSTFTNNALTSQEIIDVATHMGPVVFKCVYGWWPQWHSFHYAGKIADGRAPDGTKVGFARPLGHAGKTQLRGFETGHHFGVVLSAESESHRARPRVWLRDSDHNSPIRPEQPPYDVVTEHQFSIVYESWKQTGEGLWCAIPSKRFDP